MIGIRAARLHRAEDVLVSVTLGAMVLVPIADEWTLPWAAREERVMKRAMLAAAKADRALAPWFEVYAALS